MKLGSYHAATGQPAEALRAYQQAIEVAEKLVADNPLEPDHERILATSYARMSEFQRASGQQNEARRFCERAFEIRDRNARLWPTMAEVDKELGESYRDLGRLQFDGDHHAQAMSLYEKSRERFEGALRINPKDHRCQGGLGTTWDSMGLTLVRLGKPEEAIAAHKEAIRLQTEALAQAPELTQYREDLSKHYENLTRLYRDQNRPVEAYETSLEQQKLWTTNPEQLFAVARDVALCINLLPADKQTERERCAEQSLEILRQALRHGYNAGDQLHNSAFDPLRSRADFQELLRAR
jgi:tetratricopeptide (TPR) repeat protein